jgi:hypothetical protein
MVSHSRTPARPDHLRSLNQPQPLTVHVDRGHPVALDDHRQRHVIAAIQDTWIIEDEWWRDPISRQYFAVLLANGQTRTIYHDRIADTWFTQAY